MIVMFEKQSEVISARGMWPAKHASRLLGHVAGVSVDNRLTILIYHRVLVEPDSLRPGEPTVIEFEHDMKILSTCFKPVPLVEAMEALQAGGLPKRSVCVTFDDGYADNEKLALPLLEKYGIPATVFVSSGYLDGGRMWNDTVIETIRLLGAKDVDLGCFELGVVSIESTADKLVAIEKIIGNIRQWPPQKRQASVDEFQARVANLPDDLMLTGTQLKNLHARGIEIGGHTRNHPILSSLSSLEAMAEIVDGKRDLEARLGQKIDSFAYPNGRPGIDFNDAHAEMVRDAGFSWALTTQMGACRAEIDAYQMPRFTPWNKTPLGFTGQIWANSFGFFGK